MMTSFKKDRENRWIKLIEEMAVAAASGNNQGLFKLVHETDRRRTSASENVCNRNGQPIFAGSRGLAIGLSTS